MKMWKYLYILQILLWSMTVYLWNVITMYISKYVYTVKFAKYIVKFTSTVYLKNK